MKNHFVVCPGSIDSKYISAAADDEKVLKKFTHTEGDLKTTKSAPRCYNDDQLDADLKPYCKVEQRMCYFCFIFSICLDITTVMGYEVRWTQLL